MTKIKSASKAGDFSMSKSAKYFGYLFSGLIIFAGVAMLATNAHAATGFIDAFAPVATVTAPLPFNNQIVATGTFRNNTNAIATMEFFGITFGGTGAAAVDLVQITFTGATTGNNIAFAATEVTTANRWRIAPGAALTTAAANQVVTYTVKVGMNGGAQAFGAVTLPTGGMTLTTAVEVSDGATIGILTNAVADFNNAATTGAASGAMVLLPSITENLTDTWQTTALQFTGESAAVGFILLNDVNQNLSSFSVKIESGAARPFVTGCSVTFNGGFSLAAMTLANSVDSTFTLSGLAVPLVNGTRETFGITLSTFGARHGDTLSLIIPTGGIVTATGLTDSTPTVVSATPFAFTQNIKSNIFTFTGGATQLLPLYDTTICTGTITLNDRDTNLTQFQIAITASAVTAAATGCSVQFGNAGAFTDMGTPVLTGGGTIATFTLAVAVPLVNSVPKTFALRPTTNPATTLAAATLSFQIPANGLVGTSAAESNAFASVVTPNITLLANSVVTIAMDLPTKQLPLRDTTIASGTITTFGGATTLTSVKVHFVTRGGNSGTIASAKLNHPTALTPIDGVLTNTAPFKGDTFVFTVVTAQALANGTPIAFTIRATSTDSRVNPPNTGFDTLAVRIPALGVVTAATSNTTETIANNPTTLARDSIFIYTEPRNPSFSGAIQARDTVVIGWFVPQSSLAVDTMRALTIRLIGITDSTKVDTVFLARDVNRNRKFDTQTIAGVSPIGSDTIVGFFTAQNSVNTLAAPVDTWFLTILAPSRVIGDSNNSDSMATDTYTQNTINKLGDTAEYIVVIVLKDTTFASIRLQIPAGGAIGTFADSGPTSATTFESFFVIARDTVPPLPPIFFTVTTGVGNSFKLSFGPSASGDTGMANGQYNIFWSTADTNPNTRDSFPNTLLQIVPHTLGTLVYETTLTQTIYGFVTDTPYRFRVSAVDQAGNEGASSLVVTAIFKVDTMPVPTLQGQIVQPVAGDFIFETNAITLVAKLTSGDFRTVTQCSFYVRPASGGPFVLINSANDSTFANGSYFFSTFWNVAPAATAALTVLPGLAFPDSYELRAVFGSSTQADTYPTSININLVATQGAATYVVLQDTVGGGDSVTMALVVSTTAANRLIFVRTPTGAFDMQLDLAKGTLNLDTDRITIAGRRFGLQDSQILVIQRRGVRIPTWFFLISLQSGQLGLRNANSRITINYLDANGDNIDDSTGIDFSKSPTLYTFTAAGDLEALDDIKVDKVTKTISATVRHFSPFFISNDTGLNTVGLNRLIVGPNPWRPNDGIDENGKPFSAADATSGIMFKNLPNQCRIEIFTILGEKVTQINKNDLNATINWGARNDDGKDVASGYYLYIVTDIGSGQRVTGKVAVIR